jgi:hypothetical protein
MRRGNLIQLLSHPEDSLFESVRISSFVSVSLVKPLKNSLPATPLQDC